MEKRSVSLVLGSGGARGLAHVGIIEVLQERGFQIASISGTSIGALVGGIYAAGELVRYRQWAEALEQLDVLRLLDFSFRRSGLIKGEKVIETLRELIGDRNIQDLPIPFTAVASNIEDQKEVWINHGSLFQAIRASIAIPTLFTPVQYNGKTLVDGGLLNPIPIAPTLRDKTDLTIAVNLGGKPEGQMINGERTRSMDHAFDGYRRRIGQFIEGLQQRLSRGEEANDELGIFEVVSNSFETMQTRIARFQLAAYSPDLVIEIPMNSCAFYEFYRASELIEIGHNRAVVALNSL